MGILRLLGLCNFVAIGGADASPNLSGLGEAIKSLPPEQQAEYYAGFMEDPPWIRNRSTGESGFFEGGEQGGFAGNKHRPGRNSDQDKGLAKAQGA